MMCVLVMCTSSAFEARLSRTLVALGKHAAPLKAYSCHAKAQTLLADLPQWVTCHAKQFGCISSARIVEQCLNSLYINLPFTYTA